MACSIPSVDAAAGCAQTPPNREFRPMRGRYTISGFLTRGVLAWRTIVELRAVSGRTSTIYNDCNYQIRIGVESMSTVQVQTYLFFNGECEEALEFYKGAIGAEVEFVMHYRDSPDPMPGVEMRPNFDG